LGHDGYLKLWALSDPLLPTNVLFVDEAQDLNPVLVDVIRKQKCQIISVGDPHQQIYEWRGAMNALGILPGVEMTLSQSFRFGGEIAAAANDLIKTMNEDTPLRGNGGAGYVTAPDDSAPDAILCRTNAGVFAAAAVNPGCSIAGGTRELQTLVADIERLQNGREAVSPELAIFGNWREVVEFVEMEENSGGLAPIVRIVERNGVEYLRKILETVKEDGYPAIGTAHKTKGLEYEHVELRGDFSAENPSLEARRLFYVALTRAKYEVNVDDLILAEYLK
jgi:superfamily I DNA/RNA helicase